MIETRRNRNLFEATGAFIELVYHSIVRNIRKASGNASLGLLNELMSSMLMVGMFYVMFTFLGLKALAIRGDFVIFLLTGIFLYMTHNKAIGSVMGASNAANPIMKHAPMSPMVAILSSAIAALYLQVLAFIVILLVVHVLRGGIEFSHPSGLFLPFFLAWASGCTIGLLFNVVKPYAPKLIGMISTMYKRANMITSGKMMPANLMTASMLPYFAWNPLFHCIDQMRGHAFVNYTPKNSSIDYAIWFSVVALIIGLMGERWITSRISQSWSARQ